MATRPFRSQDSIAGERLTRAAIGPLLASRGFAVEADLREIRGTAETQYIEASHAGRRFKIHVRLCWRRTGRNPRDRLYSAAQLRTRLIDGDWDRTIDFLAERSRAKGVTHILFVQDGDAGIEHALLVPAERIPGIWRGQREVSARLVASGATGRWKKNHAENGSSPTIWLQDDRWPEGRQVADVLRQADGVVDILELTVSASNPAENDGPALLDDSIDDLGIDRGSLGRDLGERLSLVRSGYRRDPNVRASVVARAGGGCERPGCGERRDWPGFLDVHHILGVGASDRPWTCVALCPNCHREAHFSPAAADINAELERFARSFR